MSQAKRAGPPRKRHLGAQSCEDVSSVTGWTTSRAAFRTPELRRELRVARMSQARRAGPPRAGHLRAENFEDVSGGLPGSQGGYVTCGLLGPQAGPPLARHLGAQSCEYVLCETGRTTLRTASQSSELRGCLRRDGPDHVARGISEVRLARMSQAKWAGPPLAR